MRREPGRDGKILGVHRQNGNDEVPIFCSFVFLGGGEPGGGGGGEMWGVERRVGVHERA